MPGLLLHGQSRPLGRHPPLHADGAKVDCQPGIDTLSHTFEVRGSAFWCSTRAALMDRSRGLLSAQQMDVLRRGHPDGPPLSIFTHYPALRLNAPWMDANMLIFNGEEMHQALLPARGDCGRVLCRPSTTPCKPCATASCIAPSPAPSPASPPGLTRR